MSEGDLFAGDLNEPDRRMCVAELKREILVRKNVFPRWVINGRLTQENSDHRIACLERAIVFLEEGM